MAQENNPDKSLANKSALISWYLSLIGFFGIFSTTISKNPVLPLFVKGLGASASLLGIIAAASPLAGMLLSFPIGFLADKIGRRRLLLIAALIFISAPLLYLCVTNPLWLIPIRFFHGLATAIMGPVASALIISFYSKTKGEKLGLYSSATLFGRTLAPLLGGFLINLLAYRQGLFNYHAVYLTAFILSLPVLFLTLAIPKTAAAAKKGSVKSTSFKEMLAVFRNFVRSAAVISTATIDMATYFIYGVLETYLPLLLTQKGITADKVGLLFSLQVISIALTKPFFGKLADKIDKRQQIISGSLILAATTISLPLLSNYWAIIGDILIFGLGMSLSTIATSTYIPEKVAPTELASSLGLLSSIMDIGQSFGPFLIGFIITAYSYSLGFYLSGLLALVVAGIFFWKNYQPAAQLMNNQ